ncbi:hypothetical protein [Streptomyces sp. NPDC058718]|uniref:hypothetical protein n=1 Tax=Streptomyces sp. NPDC058718 TaxID=3346610 RepID=UPI0036B747E9
MTAAPPRLSLDGVVMTHPRRSHAARALSAALGDLRVVMDPHPGGSNALITSIEAWGAYAPDATHHLVLQDDVIVRPDLLVQARRAVELFPDAALSFYANWDSLNGAAARLALMAGCGWVEAVRWEFFPTLATVLPVRLLDEYGRFAEAAAQVHFEDDEVLFDFLQVKGVPGYVSVPALVEHGDLTSLVGNPKRRAACYGGGEPLRGPGQDRLAHSLTLCPFFYRGMAFLLVRVGEPADHAWRYVHWSRGAPRLGLDPAALRRRFDREFAASVAPWASQGQTEFLFSLWVVALLLGLIPRTGHLKTSGPPVSDAPASGATGEADAAQHQALIAAALGTLAPGALMDSALPDDSFAGRAEWLLRIAHDGYEAGREVGGGVGHVGLT